MYLCFLMRKPMSSSIMQSILVNQTGGLNINACRVMSDKLPNPTTAPGWDAYNKSNVIQGYRSRDYNVGKAMYQPSSLGRYPTNVILQCDGDTTFFRRFAT